MFLSNSRGFLMRGGLVGLVVGAGVCYYVYRATSRKRKNEGPEEADLKGESIHEEHEQRLGSTSWGEVQMPIPEQAPVLDHNIFSSTGQKDSSHLQQDLEVCRENEEEKHHLLLTRKVVVFEKGQLIDRKLLQETQVHARTEGMNFPVSPDGLEVNHIQSLIYLLESVEDPLIQEQALITLSNSAAFSVNQDIIRNLGGLSVIGSMLSVPATNVKEKALNALNNLSMNTKNQEELKRYITKICEETNSSPLNSELQLAGLRFLTNMSLTNYYHHMMTSSIPCFLNLLLDGDERTQTQVLKVLVNLSANPAMTEHLLSAQAPFLLSLFDSCINKEVLLRVLVFATNLTQHMKKEESAIASHHSEDSIFSMLRGNSTQCAQKLASLFHHHDTEVKEQVAKLVMQW